MGACEGWLKLDHETGMKHPACSSTAVWDWHDLLLRRRRKDTFSPMGHLRT